MGGFKSKLDRAAIAAWPAKKRYELFLSVQKQAGPEAARLMAILEEVGVGFLDIKGLSMDDPVTLKMIEIIDRPASVARMIEATEAGSPAIAAVDAELSDALKEHYGGHNQATATAGAIVADRMRMAGYKTTGRRGPLPDGSVAKTGMIYAKK